MAYISTNEINRHRPMPTATFAVQPSSFGSFDQWGCQWATDLNHAVRMAKAFAAAESAPQVIWRVADEGLGAVAWMEVGQSA